MSEILSCAELRGWTALGPAPQAFSAFGDWPLLTVALQANDPAPDLRTWLRSIVAPVVGIGPAVHPLADCCDVLIEDEAELASLDQAITAAPIAASSLVQLLRLTQAMPLEAGLVAESMCYATLQGGAEYAAWLRAHRAPAARPHTDAGPAVIVAEEGEELRLSLNRASTQNAMSVEMRDALVAALRDAAQNEVSALTIDGRGPDFSTGGELSEFGQVPDTASGHVIRMLSVPGKFLAAVADRATARVHGRCVGSGIEFPAFAGRLVAAADAQFCLPEVGMGLIPGAGGCISLARRIGRQRLAWWALSGRWIDAPTARDWGLVDQIED